MKMMNRAMSLLLVLVLLFSVLPVQAAAEQPDASVDTGDVTIEGTNSFGSMLSEEIQKEQTNHAEERYSGGYNVIGLTIEGSVATVEYDALEEAILVVALYTEDSLQMLLSGNTKVQPEKTVAEITLEGELPVYFMASAYLVDTYDYSPLCAAYDTPMYTREMQELLASTADDYDADKVLNLDDDTTTNFAVYADTTKIIEYTEGVNTVVSTDDENATYFIENADESITSLQTGDVFAYAYGENQILIVKVASIAVDGTTATITGDGLEMEEVFSHAKIEKTSNASDVTVDDSTLDEGVMFDGLTQEDTQTYGLRSAQGEGSVKNYLNYKLDKKIKSESDYTEASVTMKGSLGMELDIDISYYISTTRQFMKFETDVGLKLALSVSGKAEASVPLGDLSVMFFGVSIGFEPEMQLQLQGKVEYSMMAGFTIGYIYDNHVGLLQLNTTPKVESDFKIEASIFIGIDMAPKIDILKGIIAEAKLQAPIGLELKAKLKGTLMGESAAQGESIHSCEKCIEMELNFKMEFSAKLEFLKCKWLTLETKVKAVEVEIGEYYWSLDNSEFGEGNCPYVKHRVTVQVKTNDEQSVAGADVIAIPKELQTEINLGKTNSSGVLTAYLQSGTYVLRTTAEGETLEKTVMVKEACKVLLNSESIGKGPDFINANSIIDNGILASGDCGADGDNVTWTLYGSGLLKIDGVGRMKDYNHENYYHPDRAPWNQDPLENYTKNVIISGGITHIGEYAFSGCISLTSVTIHNGVTTIGAHAFHNCSITNVVIPDSVTTIEEGAFWDCDSLTSVFIPDSVTTIGESAFTSCGSLTSVTIPDSVTTIGESAFDYGDSLTKILVDENNVYFSDESGVLFNKEKTELIQVPGATPGSYNIPNSVTSIGNCAFTGCDQLTNVTIPDSVKSIGNCAFKQCTGLSNIIIPDNVTSIGEGAFYICDNLVSITIPDSITTIGDWAFWGCRPKDVYYCGTEEQWEQIVIGVDNEDLYRGMFHFNSSIVSPEMEIAVESEISEDSCVSNQTFQTANQDTPALFSIYDGAYSTEITDTYTFKTASFSELVPGEQYVLLALVSIETEDVLAPDNLLYIDQGTAMEDGSLVFKYVQRVTTDTSYVMASGASHNDVNDAVITFPPMEADGEVQTVNPVVTFEDKILTEGQDYVIVGTTDFTEAGTYTCYVRGIRNYTGLVTCTYTVADKEEIALFDLAGANMALGNSLTMYLFVNASDVAEGDYYIEIVKTYADGRDDVVKTVPMSEWTPNATMYYVSFDGVAAKEMTDDFYVTVYHADGTQASNTRTISIEAYAIGMLNRTDASSAATHNLMADMLNYGAAAQQSFKYAQNKLANANMTAAHKACGTQNFSMNQFSNNTVKGTGFMGANLSLESSICMYMYFDQTIVDRTMTARVSYVDHNKKTVSYEISGSEFTVLGGYGFYGVEITTMAAADAESMVTVEILDGSKVVASGSTSVESVAFNGYTGVPLYVDLMKFCTAAYDYFH